MTEDDFRKSMCTHMAEQTEFLRQINEGMQAVRMFGRVCKWITGAAGSVTGLFGLWNLLTKH
jgi:hypothetical protein